MTFESLKSHLEDKGVTLVAVSKTKPVDTIQAVYDQGQRIFGENRAQEMAEKQPQLPYDIEWHMIGHLQRNKVKYIAPFVSLIHSIDSMRLLRAVNKEALANGRVIDVLLQFKIAEEESKYGLEIDQFISDFNALDSELSGVRFRGVMGMASFVNDEKQVRGEFRTLKSYFNRLKQDIFRNDDFDVISMGMSGDYQIAIEEGSTMVRIGSLIFGPRNT